MLSTAKEPVTEVIPVIECVSPVLESPKVVLPSTVALPSMERFPPAPNSELA